MAPRWIDKRHTRHNLSLVLSGLSPPRLTPAWQLSIMYTNFPRRRRLHKEASSPFSLPPPQAELVNQSRPGPPPLVQQTECVDTGWVGCFLPEREKSAPLLSAVRRRYVNRLRCSGWSGIRRRIPNLMKSYQPKLVCWCFIVEDYYWFFKLGERLQHL